MLADLKDSVKNDRSLNIKDKYGSTAVSGCGHCRQELHSGLITLPISISVYCPPVYALLTA